MINKPHVDWFALSPSLALIGVSFALLLVAVLVPKEQPLDESSGPPSLEALQHRIIGLRNPKKDAEWNLRTGLLGVNAPASQPATYWPSQTEVADALKVTRARVGQVLAADRNRWSKDPLVTSFRHELCEQRVLNIIESLRDNGVQAVAVCLLWSILNPIHELRVGELLDAHLPGVPHTLSHQLNPVLREYRRASAAAIDASLKPLMAAYLGSLTSRLEGAGFISAA